jgi:hypothetical protein
VLDPWRDNLSPGRHYDLLTMNFTVAERIILSEILPAQQGDFMSLRLIRKFREDLSFDEEENAQLQFKKGGETLPDGTVVPPGQIRWNPVPLVKEIAVGPVVRKVISQAVLRMDKIEESWMPVLEQFIQPEDIPAEKPQQ